jgi:hypothetical protein
LQSLEVSFRSSLMRTQELERENANLALRKARRDRTIILLTSLIVFGVGAFIARAKINKRR